jgi:guanylate kinase
LSDLDAGYEYFPRLKAGPGRQDGYRMTTDARLDRLRLDDEVIWENLRYGSRYVIDRTHLLARLGSGRIPIIHLGQPDGVAALIRDPRLAARWTVAALWCPRAVAERRLIDRGSPDLSARLEAWDETPPLPEADLTIDTSQTSPSDAARLIQDRRQHEPLEHH